MATLRSEAISGTEQPLKDGKCVLFHHESFLYS